MPKPACTVQRAEGTRRSARLSCSLQEKCQTMAAAAGAAAQFLACLMSCDDVRWIHQLPDDHQATLCAPQHVHQLSNTNVAAVGKAAAAAAAAAAAGHVRGEGLLGCLQKRAQPVRISSLCTPHPTGVQKTWLLAVCTCPHTNSQQSRMVIGDQPADYLPTGSSQRVGRPGAAGDMARAPASAPGPA